MAAPREAPVLVTLLEGGEEAQPGAAAPAPPEPPAPPAPPPEPSHAPRVARPSPALPAPARVEPKPAVAPVRSAPAPQPPGEPGDSEAGATTEATAGSPRAGIARVYGEGEVDRVAAPLGGIRRPEYPARERMMGREGRVSLVVEVDAAGNVRAVTVTRSASAAFDASARRAVEQTPFRAARFADRPVASTVTVDVSFELD